jgi:hypothetical protein
MSDESVMKRIDELFQAVTELRQLTELVAANTNQGTSAPSANVVPLKNAWKRLGYVSYAACWNKVSNGHYRAGKEAIDRRKPGAQRPDWYMDIEKCQERDRARAGARR